MGRKSFEAVQTTILQGNVQLLEKQLNNKSPEFCTGVLQFAIRTKLPEIRRTIHGYNVLTAQEEESIVRNYNQMIKLILDHGADVKEKCGYYFDLKTVLEWAVHHRNKDIVKLLLDYGASVDEGKSKNDKTALLFAAEFGDLEIVKLLLDFGANINAKNNGSTVLTITLERLLERKSSAFPKEELDFIEFLLDRGAKKEKKALYMAIDAENKEIVKLLLNQGFDANFMYNAKTALIWAAKYADVESVKLLLQHGAKVNDERSKGRRNALHYAVQYGNEELIKLLVDQGADVNADFNGKTALKIPLEADYPHPLKRENIITMLLNAGATPHNGALHEAIYVENTNIVKLLLLQGSNPNCVVKSSTPLHCAVRCQNKDIVKLLLDYGAEVNETSAERFGSLYPLTFAAMRSTFEIVKLLLDYNADINVEFGEMPTTEWAVLSGNFEVCRLLVRTIILMKSQGLFVSDGNLNASKKVKILEEFQKACISEIEKLTAKKFDDSNLSYSDILRIKDDCQLAAMASNENIAKAMNADLKIKYPIYGEMIIKEFNKAVEKKKDFDLIKRFFNYLSTRDHDKLPQLPFTVVCIVFSHLKDKGVANLKLL